jgi:hypothetical protein
MTSFISFSPFFILISRYCQTAVVVVGWFKNFVCLRFLENTYLGFKWLIYIDWSYFVRVQCYQYLKIRLNFEDHETATNRFLINNPHFIFHCYHCCLKLNVPIYLFYSPLNRLDYRYHCYLLSFSTSIISLYYAINSNQNCDEFIIIINC